MIKFSPEEIAEIARQVGVTAPDDSNREHMSKTGKSLHDASYEFVVAVVRAAEAVLNERRA